MRAMKCESEEWISKFNHIEEQMLWAERKFLSLPRRYREEPRDLNQKLIAVLEEKRELELAIGRCEQTFKMNSNDQTHQLRTLLHEIRAVSEDISEIKYKSEDWGKRHVAEMSKCKVR